MKAIARIGTRIWARYGYTTAQEVQSMPNRADILAEIGKEGSVKIDVMPHTDVMTVKDYVAAHVSQEPLPCGRRKALLIAHRRAAPRCATVPITIRSGLPGRLQGYSAVSQEEVDGAVNWSFVNDIQLIVHANGEGASDGLIAVVDAATKSTPLIPVDAARRTVVTAYTRYLHGAITALVTARAVPRICGSVLAAFALVWRGSRAEIARVGLAKGQPAARVGRCACS
ncbi:hypothetical protein ACEUZ9_004411 [Paracoccus litorisediminis]|jgi:predicted amidohydrolase YtcJ|uniref:Uncharacterized protein n=1 Tax=Paracoccus litorisediminis TaxID=2006130 RepID=A0A844HX73_9RHOB|nr:hypothetical protein [Paracoccus litorisediminis]MTH62062.1 hypothetical protein [Paracoccus litorisediminis]